MNINTKLVNFLFDNYSFFCLKEECDISDMIKPYNVATGVNINVVGK